MSDTSQIKAAQSVSEPAEIIHTAFTYMTVKQFIESYPAFKTGGIRGLIFNEHENGLAKSGAIVRMGRKVLLRPDKFFEWLESGQSKQAAGS